MKTQSEDSFIANSKSAGLALLFLTGGTIVSFVVDDLVHSIDRSGIAPYVLFALVAAAGCYFIVKQNPESVWFVPLIINSLLILSAIVEDNFWKNPPDYLGVAMWIPICSGWVLCLVVSIIAAVQGKQPPGPSNASKKPIGSNTA